MDFVKTVLIVNVCTLSFFKIRMLEMNSNLQNNIIVYSKILKFIGLKLIFFFLIYPKIKLSYSAGYQNLKQLFVTLAVKSDINLMYVKLHKDQAQESVQLELYSAEYVNQNIKYSFKGNYLIVNMHKIKIQIYNNDI